MSKKERHEEIKSLVQEEQITSQDILQERLISRGYSTTQATLSRDIKELKIVKGYSDDGIYVYQLTDDGAGLSENGRLGFGLLSIEFSGNVGVIKTSPGYAMAIAGEIDRNAQDIILGTVAGDDTIFIVPKEHIKRELVIHKLMTFIPVLK